MFSLRYILPALACARVAFGAVCSTSATLTIQNSGDATALAGCNTFSGSIAVATGTTDDISLPLTSISENLVVNKALNVSSIGSDTLESIGGVFMLQGAHALSSLSFAKLSKVGAISWNDLPSLSGLEFTTGISQARTVTISDTQLTSLEGFPLEQVQSIVLNANQVLRKASFQLEKIPTLVLNNNGRGLILSLPNMKSGTQLNLIGIGSLNAPNLKSVGGIFNMQSGTYKEISLPKLETVGQTFTIKKNMMLSKLSFPQLTAMSGGFVIGSNNQLKTIDGLPKLSTIAGNLDFSGTFTDVQIPSLSSVKGAFNIESTENLDKVCKQFDSMHGNAKAIRGHYTCNGGLDNPHNLAGEGGGSSGGNGSGSGGGSGGSGGNAGSSFRPGALVGTAALLAAIFGLM